MLPDPPEQPEKETAFVVSGVQAAPTATPWEEAPLEALVPVKVIVPDVLVIELVAVVI